MLLIMTIRAFCSMLVHDILPFVAYMALKLHIQWQLTEHNRKEHTYRQQCVREDYQMDYNNWWEAVGMMMLTLSTR